MSGIGYVSSLAAIGLGSIMIKPTRGLFPAGGNQSPIIAQATVEEIHTDELEITDHPVEQGAMITDHAFKRPSQVVIHCAWSDSSSISGGLIGSAVSAAAALNPISGIAGQAQNTLNQATTLYGSTQSLYTGAGVSQSYDIYTKLRALQVSLVPFSVYTGKRVYTNMLFKSLTVTTDVKTENSLMVVAVLRQVNIVTTQTVTVPINANAQKLPKQTTPQKDASVKQLQKPAIVPAIQPPLR